MRAAAVVLAGLLVVAAGCGGGDDTDATEDPASGAAAPFPEDAVAIRASSDLGVGAERLLIGIGAADGSRLGSPGQAVSIEVYPQDAAGERQSVSGTWTWIVPDATGLYRAEAELDRPGVWAAEVVPAIGDRLDPVLFDVLADPMAPALGEQAPAPVTPTLDDLPIEELTTDPDPDPAFYGLSIDEAVANGRPTVVVFSTPAYCVSAACGPLLDHVKEVAPDHPDVDFIHVEVFTGLTDPDFVPDAAHLAPAVGPEWYNLPSEPWVFVIDEAGTVVARYEGVMDPAELDAALT